MVVENAKRTEVIVLKVERKVHVIFGVREGNAKDGFGLPMVATSNDFHFQHPLDICVRTNRGKRERSQEDERTVDFEPQFTWGETGCSEGVEELRGERVYIRGFVVDACISGGNFCAVKMPVHRP